MDQKWVVLIGLLASQVNLYVSHAKKEKEKRAYCYYIPFNTNKGINNKILKNYS